MKLSLLEKYDKPSPRYTSYPTVPYWRQAPSQVRWMREVRRSLGENREISLYLHLPFCEQLCTYCGCNKRITINHGVEQPYIKSLLQEWQLYMDEFPVRPVLKELHLGGGTPTFFSPAQLDDLLRKMLAGVDIPEDHAFGFEAHPNNTTTEHLRVLRSHGFNRISIGVQDFSPVIMTAINRRQKESEIHQLTQAAREMGYESVNYDFVYGLPFQRLQHLEYNLKQIEVLMPDRVAYYSYAHVPWKQAGQRRFTETDIPHGADKRALYEFACEGLGRLGYKNIGIDHFALPQDTLSKSAENNALHRNFMGYTPYSTNLLIGLGASAISDGGNMFLQNAPRVEDYQQAIRKGALPIHRGHQLTKEDRYLRYHIINLMCRFSTSWNEAEWQVNPKLQEAFNRLKAMEKDRLVSLTPTSVRVLKNGLPFVRNIAQCFDARYWQSQPVQVVFSQTL